MGRRFHFGAACSRTKSPAKLPPEDRWMYTGSVVHLPLNGRNVFSLTSWHIRQIFPRMFRTSSPPIEGVHARHDQIPMARIDDLLSQIIDRSLRQRMEAA